MSWVPGKSAASGGSMLYRAPPVTVMLSSTGPIAASLTNHFVVFKMIPRSAVSPCLVLQITHERLGYLRRGRGLFRCYIYEVL